VTCLAFGPDGECLATASGGKFSPSFGETVVKVWDLKTGHQIQTLSGHEAAVCGLAFSPDGRRVATGSLDRTARVWDLETGRELLTLKEDIGFVYCVAFSRDGKRLAAGGRDGKGCVWDAETGRKLATLRGEAIIFTIAFSPDGKRLATGSWEKVARIWDSETGREILTLRGHTQAVTGVAFSPDGKTLATAGSYDNTVILWDALPWRDEDLPGDSSMSYDGRAQLCRLEQWQKRQKELAAGPPRRVAPPPPQLAKGTTDALRKSREHMQQVEVCAANLLEIHAALTCYRGENAGGMPDWLSDLVATYLTSDTLLCSGDAQSTASRDRDPRLPCSYRYEFSASDRQRSNERMARFGNRVPVVRCDHHGQQVLNLAYDGRISFGASEWKPQTLEDYITTHTRVPAPVKGLLEKRFLRLFEEFRLAEGRNAQWERLPQLARRLAGHPAADADAFNYLAWDLADIKRRHPESATILARAGVALEPKEGDILDTLAWAEILAGDYASAVRHFEAAVETVTQKGVSLAGSAIALARLGQRDRAWDTLLQAIQVNAPRQYLIEAYFEANKAGLPKDGNIRQKVDQALGPAPPPEVELLPPQPRPGTAVKVVYRPWHEAHAKATQVIVHWGINRWRDPGEEAARAGGAKRVFWPGTNEPKGIEQPMAREGDGWAANLALPPAARQIELTLTAVDSGGDRVSRRREFCFPLAAARQAADSATTRSTTRASP